MQISIDKTLIKPKSWTDKVWVYALSSTCIGITSVEIQEWNEHCLYREGIMCRNSANFIRFKLPIKFYDFYQLIQKNVKSSLCISGNCALLIVTREKVEECSILKA